MNRINKSFVSMLLAAVLVLIPSFQSAVASPISDDQAPEVVGISLDKLTLKPGEVGTYTIRLKDDNPPNESSYLSWSTQEPSFEWSEETVHKLHGGNAVPGSFATDADGITSFQIQFRVLKDSPYGSYENNASVTLADISGNYTLASLPGFQVDDPAHPIDNSPTLQGEPQVGQELSASLKASGAFVSYQWFLGGPGSTMLVGSEDRIYLQHEWYWKNLQLLATAIWPDGHQMQRRIFTGSLESITVDVGTLSFSPAPRVGVKSKVIFTPDPSLPFAVAPSDIKILSTADLQPVDRTFTPFPGDEGRRITATAHLDLPAGYTAREEVSAQATIQSGTWAIGTPRVIGTPTVGTRLRVDRGTWAGNPDGFRYQWFSNGAPISNEVFDNYTVKPADAGKSLKVTATAFWSNRQQTFSATSVPVTAARGSLPAINVSVQGTAKVGNNLSASVTGTHAGTSLKYQWLRNGQAISDATAASYKLTAADYSKSVAVKVTAAKPGFNSLSKNSTSKKIGAGTFSKGTVAIAGTPKVGNKLTATTKAWPAGSKLAYQWMRDGKAIKGASKSAYTPIPADYSKAISLKVTASKAGYTNTSVSSAAKKIAKGSLATGKVQISGTPKVAGTLKAQTKQWTPGSTLKYQWLRNGKYIKSATKASYKLTSKDRKSKISVKVQASKHGYTTTRYVTSARVNVK